MRNLLTIGHFARLSGLAARTLRFYDEACLIRPAVVDPESGYRYYRPDQLQAARLVARLRMLEMPLDELRRVVEAGPGGARAVLEAHRERMLARAEAAREAAGTLERLLQEEEASMTYQVAVKEVPDVPALVVRARVERPEDCGPEIVRAFNEHLWPHLEEHGYRRAGPSFFACRDLEGEGGPAELEMVVPVAGEAAGGGRVEATVVPGGRFAATLHEGSYGEMGAAYRAVLAWAEAQGVSLEQQSREVYLVDYRSTDDDAALRTEVMYRLA